jgi:hypothetical protein
MRRITILLATLLVVLVMASGVALAVTRIGGPATIPSKALMVLTDSTAGLATIVLRASGATTLVSTAASGTTP